MAIPDPNVDSYLCSCHRFEQVIFLEADHKSSTFFKITKLKLSTSPTVSFSLN